MRCVAVGTVGTVFEARRRLPNFARPSRWSDGTRESGLVKLVWRNAEGGDAHPLPSRCPKYDPFAARWMRNQLVCSSTEDSTPKVYRSALSMDLHTTTQLPRRLPSNGIFDETNSRTPLTLTPLDVLGGRSRSDERRRPARGVRRPEGWVGWGVRARASTGNHFGNEHKHAGRQVRGLARPHFGSGRGHTGRRCLHSDDRL